MGTAAMSAKHFLIVSLAAAGFGQTSAAQDRLSYVTTNGADEMTYGILEQAFAREHLFTLAGHRSHSSHSSHRSSAGGGGHYSHTSHTSHRSSSYGGYDYPSAPAAASPAFPGPSASRRGTASSDIVSGGSSQGRQGLLGSPTTLPGLQPLSGRSERFKLIVRRVQLALTARDLYLGAIDGSVGAGLREALRRFQAMQKMTETGTITPEVLDRLMIPTE